jgi:uncharacterized protein (DUF885 family)
MWLALVTMPCPILRSSLRGLRYNHSLLPVAAKERALDRRTMILGTGATVALATGPVRTLAQSTSSSRSLNALFDQFMKESLDLSPITVTGLGLDTGERAAQKGELDDGSEAGIDRQKSLIAHQYSRLRAFNRASLGAADAISYDVVMYGLRANDAANRAFQYGAVGSGSPYVLSQLSGSYQSVPSFLDTQHTIESAADADAYLQRLAGFATLMDQELEVAHHDVALGVVPPDFVLSKTLTQMRLLRAPAPERSPLTESLARRTQARNIPGHHARQAAVIVGNKIYPALQRQIALVAEMRKTATHDAGVWRLPSGADYYSASILTQTTTTRRPAEIHRLGLDLVAEHSMRIDELMKKQGMRDGTVGERFRAMFVDPGFQYPNTEEAKMSLLADLNSRVRSVRGKLPRYFGTVPKAGVEIRRVPKEVEAGAPGGYYNLASLDGKRPGIYWINLRDIREKPKWLLPTLTYHESIPGHHLQLSIQQETALPLIRKVSQYTAYVEGWALYAEQLAAEIGEFDQDPLGRIGQLHDSMLRAVRLVIDSGIHAMKWSREQAIKYYTETLGDPVTEATSEVERYCVWPGQACCYMLGKLKFLAERERAQKSLGSRFDIRKFHDAVLLSGAVPLDLMNGISAAGA